MWNDTIASSCSINNAQCVRLYNDCICHCLPGFVLVDGTCFKSKIAIMFSIKQVKVYCVLNILNITGKQIYLLYRY